MSVISVEKDFDGLSLTLIADFDAPIERVWQVRLIERDGGTRMELRFVFASSEHMKRLERRGAFEVFPQSVGQMDALLAADMKTGRTRESNG